nr:MAG TPA: hypothetical protein [Caudoviricetes sp.]
MLQTYRKDQLLLIQTCLRSGTPDLLELMDKDR